MTILTMMRVTIFAIPNKRLWQENQILALGARTLSPLMQMGDPLSNEIELTDLPPSSNYSATSSFNVQECEITSNFIGPMRRKTLSILALSFLPLSWNSWQLYSSPLSSTASESDLFRNLAWSSAFRFLAYHGISTSTKFQKDILGNYCYSLPFSLPKDQALVNRLINSGSTITSAELSLFQSMIWQVWRQRRRGETKMTGVVFQSISSAAC